MPKAASPIRLDANLMDDAVENGNLHHRSAAETIEYWAGLGKQVSRLLDPEILLMVQAGAMRIEVKENRTSPVDPEDIFAGIEAKRSAGVLNEFLNRTKPIFQASVSQPGKLEQVMPNGEIFVGNFLNGAFVAE